MNKSANVKAFTRRRYPGDPTPSNVSATTREYLYDPGRRNGSSTPGNPFILDDGVEKRSFTYTGPFMNLHGFLTTGVAMDYGVIHQALAMRSQLRMMCDEFFLGWHSCFYSL